ncbi:MAG TPA: hypothetical protein VEE86_00505 [Thermoplasmata archaeon]|nr:hypothetical protein [Thermoplasmata archaeon]
MPSPSEPPRRTEYRELRLCSGGAGLEALPSRSVVLDLTRVREALELEGVPIIDARVVLIVSLAVETTISRSGRLLFKTRDLDAARSALARLQPLLDRSALSTGGGGR